MTEFGDWIGRTEQASDHVAAASSQALLATLDRDPDAVGQGDPLPPLFHWLYCRELARGGELDVDGHKKRGAFLPPVPLERRMWAGGHIEFSGDLRIGDPIGRLSTVQSITPKEGRAGPLVFVTLEHRITSKVGEVIEEQHLVYLERPTEPLVLRASPAPEMQVDWSDQITPDVAMLFRFSALTFNAHRIHYDRDYARDVECYPDLVVHGPLTALLLADLAVRNADQDLATFSFHARRPLFVDRPVTLQGRGDSTGAALRALDDTGAVAMTAEATFA